MKTVASGDRAVLETGSKAFMSFLKAYKENLLSYIFQFDLLDVGAVARGYGLLRLPKIPETRGVKAKSIVFESTAIDTSTIPYRHKEKEAARQRRLAQYKLEKEQERLEQEAEEGGDSDGELGSDEEGSMAGKSVKSVRSMKSNRSTMSKVTWVPSEEYTKPMEEKRKRKKKQSG
jgi:ATP-dependent RNA helicase DDX55/SPB4